MKSDYIVLRTYTSVRRGLWSGSPMMASAAAAPILNAEIVSIERSQLDQLARNRDVQAIAPAMPMRLIEPVDIGRRVSEQSLGPVTWGVKAVRADTSPFTGDGMVVAVLDTGINAAHPAFTGVELIE